MKGTELQLEEQLGRLVVTLKEHHTGQQLTIAAQTLSTLFNDVEAALGDGRAPWKAFHSRRPKPPKEEEKK